MERSEGEIPPDGLEIISIGAFFSGGPWEKKYWSSSRGKDRYPYPIGYHAVRTHAGNTYKMEIHEGLKGPLFVIISMEGGSCSGQTPDIAWENFQKRSGPRVKTWHAKRFSCKIDGIELFGFRNPHVQRLLRELAANANGTAERILIHPSVCNEASNVEQEIRSPESHTYPDLLLYLEKRQRTGKRSRKLKNTASTSIAGDTQRFKSHRLLAAANNNIGAKGNIENHGSNDLDILGQTIKNEIVDHHPHLRKRNADSVNDGLTCPVGLECYNDGKHATLMSNILDQNNAAYEYPATISSSHFDVVTDAISGIIVNKKFLLESPEFSNNPGKVSACPWEQSKIVVEDSQVAHVVPSGVSFSSLSSQDQLSSEGAIIGSHAEEGKGTYCASLSSSGKIDSDSAGQDLVKSMMTVLLPQALPLLKKTSKKKRAMNAGVPVTKSDPCLTLGKLKSSAENDETSHIADAVPKVDLVDGLPVSGSNPDTVVKMQVSESILVDSSERGIPLLKSFVPDSFEECCFINQRPPNSEFGGTGGELLSKRASSDDVSKLPDDIDGAKESSSFFHGNNNLVEIATGLNNPLEDDTILVSINPVKQASPSKHNLLEGGKDENKTNISSYPIVSMSKSLSEGSLENGINAVSNGAEGIGAVGTLVQGNALNVLSEMPSQSPGSKSRRSNFVTNLSVLSTANVNYEDAVLPSHKNLRTMNMEIPETLSHYRQDSAAKYLQKIQVHIDPSTSNTCKLSTTSDARETNFDIDTQSTASYARAVNFDGEEHALPQMQYNDNTIASGRGGNSLIHVHKGDAAASTGGDTVPSRSRRKNQCAFLPSQNNGTLLSESIVFRNIENNRIFEMNSAVNTLCTTEICQDSAPAENANLDLLNSPKSNLERQQNNMDTLMGISEPAGILCNIAPVAPQYQVSEVQVNKGMHSLSDFCPSIHNAQLPQGDVINEMIVPCKTEESSIAVSFMDEKGRTSPDKNGNNVPKTPIDPDLHACWKSVSNECSILPHSVIDLKHQPRDNILLKESKPYNEFEGFVELVACYVHPTPILSVLLSQKDDDIYICVICGLLQEKKRTLFIYRVTAERLSENCPTFLGYTSIEMLLPRRAFNEHLTNATVAWFHGFHDSRTENLCCLQKVTIERSGLQFTPDGQYLVLLNDIMLPGCSACVEEFSLPSFDHPCSSLLELKRLPNCASLVVGHNGIGGFGLWDISKRVLLSSFSSPLISISHVVPVGIFGWEKKIPVSSGFKLEEHVKEIIAATNLWFSGNGETCGGLLPNGEDIALWLLVSAALDTDEQLDYPGNNFNDGLFGQWRLAILVKKTLIMGSILDPRKELRISQCRMPSSMFHLLAAIQDQLPVASTAVASSGHGVIGTHDGLVYMWELSTGNRVANLKHLNGGVSCITTDATTNTLAVVGKECQLMLYIRTRKDPECLPQKFEKIRLLDAGNCNFHLRRSNCYFVTVGPNRPLALLALLALYAGEVWKRERIPYQQDNWLAFLSLMPDQIDHGTYIASYQSTFGVM
ncbi:hypothetical protein ACLOJK_035904 [Asimina triloba]